MIKVIGNLGCSKCAITKNMLDSKNIEYEYIIFKDTDKSLQDKIIKHAQITGNQNFPFIIDEKENIINIDEVM